PVGFAAVTATVAQQAGGKLGRKRVDMTAANKVGPDCGFDRERNELTVFWRGGEVHIGEASKDVLAERLIALIAEHYAKRGTGAARPAGEAGGAQQEPRE